MSSSTPSSTPPVNLFISFDFNVDVMLTPQKVNNVIICLAQSVFRSSWSSFHSYQYHLEMQELDLSPIYPFLLHNYFNSLSVIFS